jgi:hypothetical protein
MLAQELFEKAPAMRLDSVLGRELKTLVMQNEDG